jgi:hypothetical protein
LIFFGETQQKIIDYIPEYKKATPDKQYRKHPSTFLNNESWNDEIPTKINGSEVKKNKYRFHGTNYVTEMTPEKFNEVYGSIDKSEYVIL